MNSITSLTNGERIDLAIMNISRGICSWTKIATLVLLCDCVFSSAAGFVPLSNIQALISKELMNNIGLTATVVMCLVEFLRIIFSDTPYVTMTPLGYCMGCIIGQIIYVSILFPSYAIQFPGIENILGFHAFIWGTCKGIRWFVKVLVQELAPSKEDSEQNEDITSTQESWSRQHISLDDTSREIGAYHEAGHAVAIYFAFPSSSNIDYVTMTKTCWSYSRVIQSGDDIYNSIFVSLAGMAAVEDILQIKSAGVEDDIRCATKLARKLVAENGFSKKLGPVCIEISGRPASHHWSQKTLELVDEETISLLRDCYDNVHDFIVNHEAIVSTVARRLLDVQILSGPEVKEIIEQAIRNEHRDDTLEPEDIGTLEPAIRFSNPSPESTVTNDLSSVAAIETRPPKL